MELYARGRRAVVVDKMSEAVDERAKLGFPVPLGYWRQQPVRRPKLDAWVGTIDQILEQDKAESKDPGSYGQADLRAAAR